MSWEDNFYWTKLFDLDFNSCVLSGSIYACNLWTKSMSFMSIAVLKRQRYLIVDWFVGTKTAHDLSESHDLGLSNLIQFKPHTHIPQSRYMCISSLYLFTKTSISGSRGCQPSSCGKIVFWADMQFPLKFLIRLITINLAFPAQSFN